MCLYFTKVLQSYSSLQRKLLGSFHCPSFLLSLFQPILRKYPLFARDDARRGDPKRNTVSGFKEFPEQKMSFN